MNLFDLNNISDLPAEVKKNVKLIGFSSATITVLELFDVKNILTLDEIIVGAYRTKGLIRSRSWFSVTLYNLKRKKLIELVHVGKYRKTEQMEWVT